MDIILKTSDPRVGQRDAEGKFIKRPKIDLNGKPYTRGQRPEMAIGDEGYFVVLPMQGLPADTAVAIESPKRTAKKAEAVTDEPTDA